MRSNADDSGSTAQRAIRNFCIIAHIDHGKSTLADRLLQATGAITAREFQAQWLDQMDLERERGITIKASYVRLAYRAERGEAFQLNLIDTPGHVDFSYEVLKSLGACEGAILLVDAAQGIEAQTVANFELARARGLTLIPVLNKIDLPNAEPDRVTAEIRQLLNDPEAEVLRTSAKEGIGIPALLERIVEAIPPPEGDAGRPLAARVFDSHYDPYKGVIVYLRVVDGVLRRGMTVRFMGTKRAHQVIELGRLTPHFQAVEELGAGDVGLMACQIHDPHDVVAGDTVTAADHPVAHALPGYQPATPYVYAGLYPEQGADFVQLRAAVEKLSLNDAAFTFEPEQSVAFGPGFRCGFLGLLHMEIVQERLEREYGLSLIVTAPSVVYRVVTRGGEQREIHTPSQLPVGHDLEAIQEPYVAAFLLIPHDAYGAVMELAVGRRGECVGTEYLSPTRVKLLFHLPLAELIVDFHDRLKSVTRGYGSVDYEFLEYRAQDLVRLDVLLNNERCEPLSSIVHKTRAYDKGKALVTALKELIPRQLFEVAIQAAIGGQVIARETLRALGKHVTAKCYGGDITRKRKLWERQKRGKRRMKQFGKVELPQEAFLAVLKV